LLKALYQTISSSIPFFFLETMSKYALITGCSKGGIGEALALEFQRKGVKVFATGRDLTKVQHLKEAGIEVLHLDVTSNESIREAVATVKRRSAGRLDFLIDNSGAGSLLILDFGLNKLTHLIINPDTSHLWPATLHLLDESKEVILIL
jgi:NAD(P)-dependent dehydrogenase (short-subunit alcohol dehydrogenase family)